LQIQIAKGSDLIDRGTPVRGRCGPVENLLVTKRPCGRGQREVIDRQELSEGQKETRAQEAIAAKAISPMGWGAFTYHALI